MMIKEFHRNIGFLNDIVFLDGCSGAGKDALNSVLPLLENVEVTFWDNDFEFISELEHLSQINTNSAVALLRTKAEIRLYDVMVGRHINFRYRDSSSIFQNPQTLKNIYKIFKKDGNSVLEEIKNKSNILTIGSHFILSSGALIFKAFEERLKVIEMVRHPASLFNFWVEKNWCGRFGKDQREFTLLINHNGHVLPWFIKENIIEEYLSANPEEKIIYALHSLEVKKKNNLSSLDKTHLKSVLQISFEEYVTNPKSTTDRISSFLSRSFSNKLRAGLKKENIPRTVDFNSIQQAKDKIMTMAISDNAKTLFLELCENYESKYIGD